MKIEKISSLTAGLFYLVFILLSVVVKNRSHTTTPMNVIPEYLEYSEKDDKFRLITSGCRYGHIINLGRIISCKLFPGNDHEYRKTPEIVADKCVTLEL